MTSLAVWSDVKSAEKAYDAPLVMKLVIIPKSGNQQSYYAIAELLGGDVTEPKSETTNCEGRGYALCSVSLQRYSTEENSFVRVEEAFRWGFDKCITTVARLCVPVWIRNFQQTLFYRL